MLHNHNEIVNFSRKRGVQDGRGSYEHSTEHGSKRQRHDKWPTVASENLEDETEDAHRLAMSPARLSKFQEASMNDRPSDNPPSLFTRHLNRHVGLAMDELMDDYHYDNDNDDSNDVDIDNDKPLPPQPSTTLPRLSKSPVRRQQPSQPPLRPSASTFSIDTRDDDGRSSGIFKFGRSVATVFNPMNMWSRVTTGWRAAKEELVEEAEDAAKKESMDQRKEKAALAYAQMKQDGVFRTHASHAAGGGTVSGPDLAKADSNSNQRDSGISLDTTVRSSVDTASKGSFLLPADASSDKSRRHGRAPSLHDLKRVASSISLHRRSASSSRSPEKEDPFTTEGGTARFPRSNSRGNVLEFFGHDGALGSLRGRQSKNNLTDEVDEFGNVLPRKVAAKQVKLTKRVSSLEAKLESARKELERALGTAPPIPSMPPSFKRRPLPRPERNSNTARGFIPELPTLLSESLLLPPPITSGGFSGGIEIADDAKTVATTDVLHFDEVSAVASDIKDEPFHESHGNSLYMQQNQPLLKADITNSPPAKESITSTPESKKRSLAPAPETPSTEQTFLVDASPPLIGSAKKLTKASNKKKKFTKADRSYRPSSDSNFDDDVEWKATQKLKTKRKSEEGLPPTGSPKRARTSHLPVAANESPKSKDQKIQKLKVLRKPVPEPAKAPKDLPPTPLDLAAAGHDTLDTVPEDTVSFTNVIPAKKGSPRKPTAKATPAAFHPYRSPSAGSSSPSYASPKRNRNVLTPKRAKGRADRSPSPPPSSARFKPGSDGDKVAKSAQPNGRDVPPMPKGGGRGLENKSSFEWPEDVF